MALETQPVGEPKIVIDARAQLDGAPVALATAHEETLLEHLLRYVLAASTGEVAILAEAEQVEALRACVNALQRRLNVAHRIEVSAYPPESASVRLRADTVYDLPRLRRRLKAGGDPGREALWRIRAPADLPRAEAEIARAVDWYPISRWYLRPWARRLARGCGVRGVSAIGLTGAGFALAVAAALMMPIAVNAGHGLQPWASLGAAALLLGYWLFDQADGYLARLTGTASAYGGWLDANLDELVDLGVHVSMAGALTAETGSVVPLWLLVGFVVGKYLFVYGLNASEPGVEEGSEVLKAGPKTAERGSQAAEGDSEVVETGSELVEGGFESDPLPPRGGGPGWGGIQDVTSPGCVSALRRLWNLPADADVRLHLLVAAVATGQIGFELAFVAAYYNLRWLARHVLLARRAMKAA